MSESTNSPTSTPTLSSPTSVVGDSSTPYANLPLVNLLRKPLHLMSQDEIRVYSTELRTLRLSPQSLGKQLRVGSAEKEAKEDARVPRAPQKSVEDLMKELDV